MDEATQATLPDGDYAIVECLGHKTLVGRVEEVERFGTKLLQVEPIFNGQLLPATLCGGGSIYAFTPCSKEVAAKRGATREYELPVSVRAAMPEAMLPPPTLAPAFLNVGEEEEPEMVGF